MGIFGSNKKEKELEILIQELKQELNDSNFFLNTERTKNEKLTMQQQELRQELNDSKSFLNTEYTKNENLNVELEEKEEIINKLFKELGNIIPDLVDNTLKSIEHDDLLSVKDKVITMMSKVSRSFSDEVNLKNLVEMGYGEEEYLERWFQKEMPGRIETGKDYIIGRFLQMLRAYNMIHQDIRDHVIIDEAGGVIENEYISARIDEIAELNDAHSLASSFEQWEEQFLMALKEHDIDYEVQYESYITSYLVLETMFRAMILRMD